MSRKPVIYFAGPLFTIQDRRYLEEISELVEAAGAKTFLPHRDNQDNARNRTPDTSRKKLRSIFKKDIQGVEKADAIITFLDGVPVDAGTAIELGYAYSRSKSILGIKSDFRVLGNFDNQLIDLMVENVCSKIIFIPDGDWTKLTKGINQFVRSLIKDFAKNNKKR